MFTDRPPLPSAWTNAVWGGETLFYGADETDPYVFPDGATVQIDLAPAGRSKPVPERQYSITDGVTITDNLVSWIVPEEVTALWVPGTYDVQFRQMGPGGPVTIDEAQVTVLTGVDQRPEIGGGLTVGPSGGARVTILSKRVSFLGPQAGFTAAAVDAAGRAEAAAEGVGEAVEGIEATALAVFEAETNVELVGADVIVKHADVVAKQGQATAAASAAASDRVAVQGIRTELEPLATSVADSQAAASDAAQDRAAAEAARVLAEQAAAQVIAAGMADVALYAQERALDRGQTDQRRQLQFARRGRELNFREPYGRKALFDASSPSALTGWSQTLTSSRQQADFNGGLHSFAAGALRRNARGTLVEAAQTNKVTARKGNYTLGSLTGQNVAKGGGSHASTVVEIVDLTSVIATDPILGPLLAEGKINGNVPRLNNSSAPAAGYMAFAGSAGNLNVHKGGAFIRSTGAGNVAYSSYAGASRTAFGSTGGKFVWVETPAVAPSAGTVTLMIQADAGVVAEALVPTFAEGSYLLSPHVPDGDPLAVATRSGDLLTYADVPITGDWALRIEAEISQSLAGIERYLVDWTGAAGERIAIWRDAANAMRAVVVVGGVTQYDATLTTWDLTGFTEPQFVFAVLAYADGVWRLTVNQKSAAAAAGSVPAVTTQHPGRKADSTAFWNDPIRSIEILPWAVDVTSEEVGWVGPGEIDFSTMLDTAGGAIGRGIRQCKDYAASGNAFPLQRSTKGFIQSGYYRGGVGDVEYSVILLAKEPTRVGVRVLFENIPGGIDAATVAFFPSKNYKIVETMPHPTATRDIMRIQKRNGGDIITVGANLDYANLNKGVEYDYELERVSIDTYRLTCSRVSDGLVIGRIDRTDPDFATIWGRWFTWEIFQPGLNPQESLKYRKVWWA